MAHHRAFDMRFEDNTSVDHAAAKIVVAGAAGSAAHALSINSWGDAAAFAAFCYSVIMICEWMWRRFLRDCLSRTQFFQKRGWLKPRMRRRGDSEYYGC